MDIQTIDKVNKFTNETQKGFARLTLALFFIVLVFFI